MADLVDNIVQAIQAENDRIPGMHKAMHIIINLLINGRLKVNEPVKETVLAKEYSINRAAMREALNQLVGWGVLDYIPYRGNRVKKFTEKDWLEWHEMREAIEPVAARLLAQNHSKKVMEQLEQNITNIKKYAELNDVGGLYREDMAFHLGVIRNCGNRRFASPQNMCYLTMGFIWSKDLIDERRKRFYLGLDRPKARKDLYFKIFYEHHNDMFSAILSGDAKQAQDCFALHTRGLAESTKRILKNQDESDYII